MSEESLWLPVSPPPTAAFDSPHGCCQIFSPPWNVKQLFKDDPSCRAGARCCLAQRQWCKNTIFFSWCEIQQTWWGRILISAFLGLYLHSSKIPTWFICHYVFFHMLGSCFRGITYNVFKTFSLSIQRPFPSALISHFSSLPISAPKCCSPHLSGSLIPNQLQTARRKGKKKNKPRRHLLQSGMVISQCKWEDNNCLLKHRISSLASAPSSSFFCKTTCWVWLRLRLAHFGARASRETLRNDNLSCARLILESQGWREEKKKREGRGTAGLN